MKQSLFFFFKYYLFWIAYFLFFKAFFILYNISLLSELSLAEILGIFGHGLLMDISAAGYLTLLPGLVLALGTIFSLKVSSSIIRIYTQVLLIVLVIMGLGDSGLYKDWGSRLNTQIFLYLENPGGMYAAMSMGQIIGLLLLWIGLSWGWFWVYKKCCGEISLVHRANKWPAIPLFLFLSTALILPIRGGINTSPLNHSSVYFSENLQANQSAYNYFWNFLYSVSQQKYKKEMVHYMPSETAKEIVERNLNSAQNYPNYILPEKGTKPNVILVLLESFSYKLLAAAGHYPTATPHLNALCKEGILFSNFFATGNRSDRGMCALIGGYPSLMSGTTVLAFPDKMNKLYYFPKKFFNHGYNLSFYYGGDINFYNTKTALIQSGFSHLVSNIDFPAAISGQQKWGVPDHYLYDRMIQELLQTKQPFFSMVYNISSHEPFDVPYHKIKGDGDRDKYLNAIAYSDSCLGVFISKLKKSKLWKNSLVIITSDHCTLLPEPTSVEEPASYRIPLLWTGGVIDTSFVCDQIAMQNDLGPTLIQQMGWQEKPPKFSKNIFGNQQFAFYFRDIGWGYVSPSISVFNNIHSKKLQFFEVKNTAKTDSLIIFAKAFVQYVHDDFAK